MKRTFIRTRKTRALALVGAIATATACVPSLATDAQAQAGREPRQARRDARIRTHHGPRAAHAAWDRLLAAADELDLSENQMDKLRAIRRSAPGVLMPKRQAVAEARLDLSDLMARKDADATELTRAHERLVQARGAMSMAAFDLRMQARQVLTEQQRDKVRDHMEQRRPFRRGALPPIDDETLADAFEPFDAGLDPFETGVGPED